MNGISISRLVVVVLIAFVASFSTVFGDGVRTAEAKDIAELGAVMALYGSKAVAAGVTAAMSAALGFLTMPFKGVEAHLVGHMCKYIFRYGKKDNKTQELGKVIWYATWLMLDQGADPDALRKSVEEAINDQNV